MENNRILKFGDIFRLGGEHEFVFLHLTVDFIYVARIFDKTQTQQVQFLYNKKFNQGHLQGAAKDNQLYSFVILTTEEYRERMANFANPQKDVNIIPDVIGKVNEEDLAAIKKEILSDECPVATVVKEYIKSLS